MICALYTLKREYKDKKIYIWNINWDSIAVFLMLAFRRIDIQGFVTLQREYVGKEYMNRPVVALDYIEMEEDSLILVSDEVPREIFNLLPKGKAVYWENTLDLNEELRERKVIIYGIGCGTEKICNILAEKDIEADLYCVTKKEYDEQYNGKEVIESSELLNYEEYAVIIGARRQKSRWEMLEALSEFSGQIYMRIENIVGEEQLGLMDVHNVMFIQSINYALEKNREIYLYGKKNAIADLIEEVLSIFGIEIGGYVCEVGNNLDNTKSIYDLAYEGVEDKLIIINEEFPEHLIRARENIELAGFSLEKGNYTALQRYKFSDDKLMLKIREHFDPLVGGSTSYSQGKPGWRQYGKEENAQIRIVVLGGSTSSEIYHPENWVSKLYYKLLKENIEVVIYNGAHPGNDIVSEMLRLLRDAYVLKPQLVISLSGVNNILYKDAVNQFNEQRLIQWVKTLSNDKEYCSGLYDEEPLYFFWYRNVKILKLIAEFYKAKFFCFLQPINILMEHMSLQELSFFEGETSMVGCKEFAPFVNNDGEDYINLLRLFDHKEGMYLDSCHYTDKAQQIIADKIYEIVMPTIWEISSSKEGKSIK